jgi:hypothetical protein
MATKTYNVGNTPPLVVWTVVRGDTASFKVYVTDDAKQPLDIPSWSIKMDIERNGQNIVVLYPEQDPDDAVGEFTVFLDSTQSELLQTDDIFDIQLTDPTRVWTVAQGKMHIIEDVTEPEGQS